MIKRFSIITPNYNSGAFLEDTLRSVISQDCEEVELEYIVVDGGSTDNSHEILARYEGNIDHLLVEPDTGPANAINKGLRLATGDVVAWLNADDYYYPGALKRVKERLETASDAAFCFGSCPIVDHHGQEIRQGITRFKEFFFPVSSRFVYQCINYISQPAMFFRYSALNDAGYLREDMVAAWDYEFLLRLWRQGKGLCIQEEPLSAFRWHEQSISGQHFSVQFKEEYEAARLDAGWFSLQTFIHLFVRWGIVGAYSAMFHMREMQLSGK